MIIQREQTVNNGPQPPKFTPSDQSSVSSATIEQTFAIWFSWGQGPAEGSQHETSRSPSLSNCIGNYLLSLKKRNLHRFRI